jgi:hypothetical protein
MPAPAGYYISSTGSIAASECKIGTYSSATGSTACLPSPVGYYVSTTAAIDATLCPVGMTTATTASKTIEDCHKPIVQTIPGLKAPKALKFKAITNLAIITNTKALASFTVTGPCTTKVVSITTTVNGQKTTTKMLKVTAGKKAGKCAITLTSPTSGKYLDLKKVVQIKVSKTGK